MCHSTKRKKCFVNFFLKNNLSNISNKKLQTVTNINTYISTGRRTKYDLNMIDSRLNFVLFYWLLSFYILLCNFFLFCFFFLFLSSSIFPILFQLIIIIIKTTKKNRNYLLFWFEFNLNDNTKYWVCFRTINTLVKQNWILYYYYLNNKQNNENNTMLYILYIIQGYSSACIRFIFYLKYRDKHTHIHNAFTMALCVCFV